MPRGDSPTAGALVFDFAESGVSGYSRREAVELCPAVGFVDDDLPINPAPEHLPASDPQAPSPEAAGPSRLPGLSRLDKLYEPHFRRLELALEAPKAKQLVVPELPNVPEENASAQIHEPSSVTQGYVPVLDVVDVKTEAGSVVFGSALVERKAGVRK